MQTPGRGHHRQHGLTFKKVKTTQNFLELVTLQPAILELQTIEYAHEFQFQHILIQIFYKTRTIAFNEIIFCKVIDSKNKRCLPGGFSIAKTCNGSKENSKTFWHLFCYSWPDLEKNGTVDFLEQVNSLRVGFQKFSLG